MSDTSPSIAAPIGASPQGGIFSISGRHWLILLMVQLSNILFGMTITLANVVLPQIRGAMSVTQDEISWVITLNLVATAVATPMTHWLASRLGWRTLMFSTVLGFTVSSFMCATATSLESLILYRVLQGLCGAPIMPMGQAILLATFPRHLQPTALVIWGVGAVFGPVLGPILGTVMTELYDWRAAFLMVVPPGFCALICIWFALRGMNERTFTRLDWTGFLTLSSAVVAAQLILDRGQRMDWFEAPELVLIAVIGLVSLWMFVSHCLTARDPFLNPRLFLDRNFTIGITIAFVMGMLSFTSLTLFPSLLHDLRGYPDNVIGWLVAARGIGNWLAFLVIVPFTRVAPRTAIATGLAIQAFSGLAMAQFDINLTFFDIFWTHLLQGFGQSVTFTPMTVVAFSTLPKAQMTEGSAIFTLMRNFGSSLFISITVLVLVRSTSVNYARMSEFVNPYNRILLFPDFPQAWSLDTAVGLTRLSNEVQRQAAMIGYVNAFYLMGFTALVSIPLACLLRRAPKVG
ncbi:MAG: DHA2 family efflux MFS transporter permease subunit [Acetobacteraceae bacterium]|nr:DHA2 family efflux MFS transporter permease subunit [Acetobacteraceae bacterium]